ncbi:unnamed protein product [Vitrella brassicaformis CCMP3155]|uniref:Uncharacterized protein n=1 Tax=Vitrella brassicaformis (strain CCMP3155) TaxID=1169540 RepID=A0A0G4FTU2_VITBC|nr:unnamed protein product [Vitrella brassicaformis CCMP3155]|eukprot:CEM18367.1 unnamed protein product [Vitrella brassicaformis CCMP3155]
MNDGCLRFISRWACDHFSPVPGSRDHGNSGQDTALLESASMLLSCQTVIQAHWRRVLAVQNLQWEYMVRRILKERNAPAATIQRAYALRKSPKRRRASDGSLVPHVRLWLREQPHRRKWWEMMEEEGEDQMCSHGPISGGM